VDKQLFDGYSILSTMLHRYVFSNFQSFAEPAEVDLRLNGKVPHLGWEASSASGQRLTTAMAVMGPNASGKTALLKPLSFLIWFVSESFRAQPDAPIPLQPHFSLPNEPSDFEVEAEDPQGRLWRYVLRANRQRVLHESLYLKKKQFGYVFVREWSQAAQGYDIKQQGFGFAAAQARKVRQNASLISTAAQYGVELAQDLANSHLQTNVDTMGRLHYREERHLPAASEHFAANDAQKETMVRLLRAWDLGMQGVELRELTTKTPTGEDLKFWWPFGLHAARDGQQHELNFWHESSGTQSAFVLLSKLLPVLADGGLAVIDEFENDLHPNMLDPILSLFSNPATNPYKAQIIFTCHAAEVLNILHKSQVMLVEKNEHNESAAWRMDKVRGIRNDDNFYAKYMAGAYGAVPQV
jgi:uncharacterized protein